MVYRVYPNDNSDTFKFGLTSTYARIGGEDGWVSDRPAKAISNCENYYAQFGYSGGCNWSLMRSGLPSYGIAREVEYGYIIDYAALNSGYCPPGQALSCK